MFAAAGDMGARIVGHDWVRAGLGEMTSWSPTLWSTLSLCLHSRVPSAIYWGDEHRLLYNDAWAPLAGTRHPWGLGRPAREVWSDIWHVIEPQFAAVRARCRGFVTRDEPLPMARGSAVEDSFWDYSFTPITEPDGTIAGIFNQGHETTARVHAARHDALLVALAERLRGLETAREILTVALELVGTTLGVSRAGLSEIDAARGLTHIERCWTDGSLDEIAGTRPIAAFGTHLLAAMAQGRPIAVADTETDPHLDAAQRAYHAAMGVRARLLVPVIQQGRPVAVLFAHDRAPRIWSAHHQAMAAAVAEPIWHAVTRVRAEAALRDSEERHRLIFEQTDAILFSTDLGGRITACNPAAARAFGRPADALLSQPLAGLVDAAGSRMLTDAMTRVRAHGGTAAADLVVAREGGPRHLEATASPALDRDGLAIGFHAIARDVTQRRAGEQRQQRLVNELNHRVKNTLALVQGIALQTFREGRPLAEERAAFQQRLGALAAAHDLLTRAHWEGATLAALAANATRALADPPGRVTIAGPPLTLAPKAATSLALALHELAVNATSHGALAVPEGRLAIGWRIEDGRLRIEWRETGGPPVAAPAVLGFGLRMAQRTLAADFRGQVCLDFGAAGFRLTLDAPLPAPAAPMAVA